MFRPGHPRVDLIPMSALALVRLPTGSLRLAPVPAGRVGLQAAWLTLAAAGVAAAGLAPTWHLGVVPFSPLVLAAPPALAVAVLALRPGGTALLRDLAGHPLLAVPFVTGVAGVIVVWSMGAPRLSGWDAMGLVTAAAFEETVFRVAVPACTWHVLRAAGFKRAGPPVAGIVAAATFAVMPGHVAQMASPALAVPFVCLAVLLLGVVWLGRDPVLAVLLHLTVNAWMLAAAFGAVPPGWARLGTALVVVPVGVALARRTR